MSKFNFPRISSIMTIATSIIAVIISVASYKISIKQADYEKRIASRRFIIETLKEMQETQDKLREVRQKISGENNLSEKEILLLNYYEILSKTLAENKDIHPDLFTWAQCTHENSVRLRKKPSKLSEQIGGVWKDERVVVLGTFSYDDKDIWYYVITRDKKIGWAYKYFKTSE